ncbi:MAG: enoyl-CoA hydratase-related protein [Polyangiaceae bacterium]
MNELVRLERRAAVAVVTLDRPERMNALSWATVQRLGEIGRELTADSTLRVCVLTGVGDKAFCAGADLKERQGMSHAQVREMLSAYRTELRWLSQSEFVSVAAINGVALGGGLELALSCDLRSITEQATLGLPETGLGIIPGAGGTQRLARLVGVARALDITLTQRRIAAAEALSLGLVNRVFPVTESVLDSTLKWLEPVAEGAPIAQRGALFSVRATQHLSLDAGLDLERELYDRCLDSADRDEALRAVAEKRKPQFQGK